MKILDQEIVARFHVEYDEEETMILKVLGLLPPYAETPARLWSTQTEIDNADILIASARGHAQFPRPEFIP